MNHFHPSRLNKILTRLDKTATCGTIRIYNFFPIFLSTYLLKSGLGAEKLYIDPSIPNAHKYIAVMVEYKERDAISTEIGNSGPIYKTICTRRQGLCYKIRYGRRHVRRSRASRLTTCGWRRRLRSWSRWTNELAWSWRRSTRWRASSVILCRYYTQYWL